MPASYANHAAILAASASPTEASNIIQRHLQARGKWLKKWNNKVNSEKSTDVTFSRRREDRKWTKIQV